jgi:NADH-quinone oxidoreductase subunit N
VSSLLAADFVAPSIAYGVLSPMLIVFGAAAVGVLIEAFVPRVLRGQVQMALALGATVAAFIAVCLNHGTREIVLSGAIVIDPPALFLQGIILIFAFLSLLLVAERGLDPSGDAFAASGSTVPGSDEEREAVAHRLQQTEVFPLLMFSVGGMLMFPASGDLISLFVALEVLSLPLYLLCGLARRRRLLSQEAALKYFLLGSFASAFFLYGTALLYGFAGSTSLSDIHDAVGTTAGLDPLLFIGSALVAVGVLFKVGAVPFQRWVPDVYQGAPTPITAFMAICTKIAAFGALARIFYVALGGIRWDWRPMMWGVAILTMIVGSVVALTQTDVKRLLAYSSIAHAGFILTGVLGVSQKGLSATLFYLLAYGFVTIGAFAVITLVRDSAGEATHLSQWAGLGRRSPLVAGAFALFLLAFAGIPPTSGFVGKLAVFSAAQGSGAGTLVIVGVLASAIAAFFYVRVIVLMFFSEPAADGPTVAVPSILTRAALVVAVAGTVVLGVAPQPFLDLADKASLFTR